MIVFWTSAGRPCGGLFSIFNRRLADGLNMPGADAESAELQPAADSRQPYRERRSQMEIQGGRGEDAQCEAGESEIQELPVYLPGVFPRGVVILALRIVLFLRGLARTASDKALHRPPDQTCAQGADDEADGGRFHITVPEPCCR